MEKQEAADIHLDRTEEGYIACSSFFLYIKNFNASNKRNPREIFPGKKYLFHSSMMKTCVYFM